MKTPKTNSAFKIGLASHYTDDCGDLLEEHWFLHIKVFEEFHSVCCYKAPLRGLSFHACLENLFFQKSSAGMMGFQKIKVIEGLKSGREKMISAHYFFASPQDVLYSLLQDLRYLLFLSPTLPFLSFAIELHLVWTPIFVTEHAKNNLFKYL